MTRSTLWSWSALAVLCAVLITPASGVLCGQGVAKEPGAAAPPTAMPTTAPSRDHLVGWFALPARQPQGGRIVPGRETLVPVLKHDGSYYSVCKGFEVPLQPCPDGLEWALTPSSMKGTRIAFDPASSSYYVVIVDQQDLNNNENSMSGQKQPVTKVDAPVGLLDPTAPAPKSIDDLVGWYQPVWGFPMRLEIRKEDGRYWYVGQFYSLQDLRGTLPRAWKTQGEPRELKPLPDRVGFAGLDLTYNESLKRFELKGPGSPAIVMPLARIPAPPSPDGGATPLPIRIGIPSW